MSPAMGLREGLDFDRPGVMTGVFSAAQAFKLSCLCQQVLHTSGSISRVKFLGLATAPL